MDHRVPELPPPLGWHGTVDRLLNFSIVSPLPQSQLPKEDKTWAFTENDQRTAHRLARLDWDIDTSLATPSSVGLGQHHHHHWPLPSTDLHPNRPKPQPRYHGTSGAPSWPPSITPPRRHCRFQAICSRPHHHAAADFLLFTTRGGEQPLMAPLGRGTAPKGTARHTSPPRRRTNTTARERQIRPAEGRIRPPGCRMWLLEPPPSLLARRRAKVAD